jgi:hypothetical protein
VTNAVVTWNTVYIAAALERLRQEGHAFDPDALGHRSPALYDHINPYGQYRFDLDQGLSRRGLRPLREPESAA